MSSGTRSLIGEATTWLVTAGIVAGGLLYFNDLRSFIGGAAGIHDAPVPSAARAVVGDKSPSSVGIGKVELTAGASGHYHADAEINGRPIEVMVDTGATLVALTYEDAERAGLRLKPSDFTRAMSTANGITKVAPVTLERVSIGPITVRDVAAAVSEEGKLRTTLLGMSFLGRLERVDIRSGRLILEE
jgi:aspartyl protease family protein